MPGAVPAIPPVRRLKNSSRSAVGSSSRVGRSRSGVLRSIVPSPVSLAPIERPFRSAAVFYRFRPSGIDNAREMAYTEKTLRE